MTCDFWGTSENATVLFKIVTQEDVTAEGVTCVDKCGSKKYNTKVPCLH